MCLPSVPQTIARYCHNQEPMCGLCDFSRKIQAIQTKNSLRVAVQLTFNRLTGAVPETRLAQQNGFVSVLLAWPDNWPPQLDNSNRSYLSSFDCNFDVAVCCEDNLVACLEAANQIPAALGDIEFLTLGSAHAADIAKELAAELKVPLYGLPANQSVNLWRH